jgi:hypothetical protein
MGKLIERCAGIDIGKRFLLCCVMTGAAHEEPRSETRRFGTTVPGLKRKTARQRFFAPGRLFVLSVRQIGRFLPGSLLAH